VPVVITAVERRLRLDWPPIQSGSWDAIGVTAFLVASGLGLWSCVTMALVGRGTPLPADTARNLVIAGPYRFVRNPMAVAGAVQTTAVGLITGSWLVVVIAVTGAVAWHLVIRPTEEADLADRFGAPYDRYRASVRCWVPTMRTSTTTGD
jgi:protein-S-isoprenylcysteine O-methyltransferase Ste14